MPSTLIAYATAEGHTRKIAQAVADRLAAKGGETTLIDVTDATSALDVAGFDMVLIAAPIHYDGYQAAARHFVTDHAEALNARPSAFISVSLSAVADERDGAHSAEACAQNFFELTEWTPQAVHQAAGALRYSEYDFMKRWVAKQVAKQRQLQGEEAGDIEFTDWAALDAFVDDFFSAVMEGAYR